MLETHDNIRNITNSAEVAEQALYALPSLAHMQERAKSFDSATLYVDSPDDASSSPANQPASHAPRPLARQVYNQHLGVWGSLKREALRARASYVFTARAAAVAQFRGQSARSERLARLAYKQRMRWCDASHALDFFEN